MLRFDVDTSPTVMPAQAGIQKPVDTKPRCRIGPQPSLGRRPWFSGSRVPGFSSCFKIARGMQGPGVEPCIPNWLRQLNCCNAALILLPPITRTCASCCTQVSVTICFFDFLSLLVRYYGHHFRNNVGLSVQGAIGHPDHCNYRQADDQRQW